MAKSRRNFSAASQTCRAYSGVGAETMKFCDRQLAARATEIVGAAKLKTMEQTAASSMLTRCGRASMRDHS
jgi:hypothetical protein